MTDTFQPVGVSHTMHSVVEVFVLNSILQASAILQIWDELQDTSSIVRQADTIPRQWVLRSEKTDHNLEGGVNTTWSQLTDPLE